MGEKENIEKLFKTGRTLYYSDIVQELGLDLEMVVDICSELYKEGKVGIDTEYIEPLKEE